VTAYFEVINMSAPHIYHTALVLAPQESIVRKLYQSHAHPFTRLVHGAPISWDLHIAATAFPSKISLAVWSPCNEFVAIAFFETQTVDVLDPVTLQQLQTLKLPQDTYHIFGALIFSPNGHVLTCFSQRYKDEGFEGEETVLLVNWDLQTGGVTSIIRWPEPEGCRTQHPSIAYSVNGTLVGVSYWQYNNGITTANISICDIASGICMHSHLLDGNVVLSNNIWTCGESFQFATADATAITIWEVGFISSGTPTKVETFPAPDNFGPTVSSEGNIFYSYVQFLPTPCLLSISSKDRALVWDIQNSRCLLDCTDIGNRPIITFSSDGNLFAYTTSDSICLWKNSPTGYLSHRTPAPRASYFSGPLLSQNGESIAVFSSHTIWFWHTNNFTTHPPSILTQDLQCAGDFILDFSPDGILVVAARMYSNTAVVFNLKSGVPQLTISVDICIHGLGLTGNTVVVMGNRKVIAWDLPAEDCVPGARVGPEDSSWTTNLEDMTAILSDLQRGEWTRSCGICASISPDSSCVAITVIGDFHKGEWFNDTQYLCIYSVSTGECLGYEETHTVYTPWFAPDGCTIWCADNRGEVVMWRVDEEYVLECLGHTVDPEHPPEGYPWASPHGYQVTNDWWILGPDRKRLLMLPPLWHSM
jgi:hypothetical protein